MGVVALALGAGLSIEADASAGVASSAISQGSGGPVGNLGNGRHNRNSFVINSPSISNDIQHIRNINVGGNTVTPAAMCKRHVRRCKIIQHLVVDYP
ncbi:hypothetical protein [Actinoallomurus bryophytorum]|uniref:hypothetical protein n=1 Tax=Actinoallomurus bryophytorum TaxID=1490222 RepID=UPI00114E6D09|nr:hypothetical protein [Actinoallomurus bryophytorum]